MTNLAAARLVGVQIHGRTRTRRIDMQCKQTRRPQRSNESQMTNGSPSGPAGACGWRCIWLINI